MTGTNRTLAELEAGLADVRRSPTEAGTVTATTASRFRMVSVCAARERTGKKACTVSPHSSGRIGPGWRDDWAGR